MGEQGAVLIEYKQIPGFSDFNFIDLLGKSAKVQINPYDTYFFSPFENCLGNRNGHST